MVNRAGAVEFIRYVKDVITPIIAASDDDGALAVFINRQLDEWELEAERPEGVSFAPRVVAYLEYQLCKVRGRIQKRIRDAEAVLNGIGA